MQRERKDVMSILALLGWSGLAVAAGRAGIDRMRSWLQGRVTTLDELIDAVDGVKQLASRRLGGAEIVDDLERALQPVRDLLFQARQDAVAAESEAQQQGEDSSNWSDDAGNDKSAGRGWRKGADVRAQLQETIDYLRDLVREDRPDPEMLRDTIDQLNDIIASGPDDERLVTVAEGLIEEARGMLMRAEAANDKAGTIATILERSAGGAHKLYK